MLWVLNCKHRGKMKGTVELTQKFLGLPFFFNKYNSYDCTSYEKKKRKGERNSELWSQESPTGTHSGSFLLTHNRHCTEGHNQWERSKGVGGKHSQFSQHQQEQSTPPSLGFEVGSGVFGACQPDVAVFLGKKTEIKQLCHVGLFISVQDEHLLQDTHLEVECNAADKMPKNSQ